MNINFSIMFKANNFKLEQKPLDSISSINVFTTYVFIFFILILLCLSIWNFLTETHGIFSKLFFSLFIATSIVCISFFILYQANNIYLKNLANIWAVLSPNFLILNYIVIYVMFFLFFKAFETDYTSKDEVTKFMTYTFICCSMLIIAGVQLYNINKTEFENNILILKIPESINTTHLDTSKITSLINESNKLYNDNQNIQMLNEIYTEMNTYKPNLETLITNLNNFNIISEITIDKNISKNINIGMMYQLYFYLKDLDISAISNYNAFKSTIESKITTITPEVIKWFFAQLRNLNNYIYPHLTESGDIYFSNDITIIPSTLVEGGRDLELKYFPHMSDGFTFSSTNTVAKLIYNININKVPVTNVEHNSNYSFCLTKTQQQITAVNPLQCVLFEVDRLQNDIDVARLYLLIYNAFEGTRGNTKIIYDFLNNRILISVGDTSNLLLNNTNYGSCVCIIDIIKNTFVIYKTTRSLDSDSNLEGISYKLSTLSWAFMDNPRFSVYQPETSFSVSLGFTIILSNDSPSKLIYENGVFTFQPNGIAIGSKELFTVLNLLFNFA